MIAENIAKRVKAFAERNCRGQSSLYEHLCTAMAEDEQLLEILAATPEGQPVPNLFLAAVHFLLLRGEEHSLADCYPSCAEFPLPFDEGFPNFRIFCLEHEKDIRGLLATRRVQTNEVRRCAYLFPAFAFVSNRFPGVPLGLVEIGTSAGLLLNWDKYRYDFADGTRIGDPRCQVQIQSEWRGTNKPQLPDRFPNVVERVGIDLHVVDVTKSEEAIWLRSLTWPDQPQRMKLIDEAIAQFKEYPVKLMEGDGFDLLPAVMGQFPDEALLCIFHCHTLNQFSDEQREQFRSLLSDLSKERALIQLSAEWLYTPQPELRLIQWEKGTARETLLANIDQHGQWIEWIVEDNLA